MSEEYTNIRPILEKSADGDPLAAGQLYEMYRSKGISIAMEYVGNRDDAEDMYQDSFLKALTNIDKYDTLKPFAHWLETIVENTCKNFLAKKREIHDEIPELTYDRSKFMEIMDGIINELPQAQKEAVILFYYKEMSIRQIAEYQSVPEDAVKSRLDYSRKKVETAVEEYEKKTGIKLRGAILIPLMYFLFYKKSVYAAQAESVLADGSSVAEYVPEYEADDSSDEMVQTATETEEKTGLSIALKIVISVVAAAVIGTTAYTAYTVIDLNEDDKQTEPVTDLTENENNYVEQKPQEENQEKTYGETDRKLMAYLENHDYEQGTPYALHDINGDGKHELIIRGGSAEQLYPYVVEIVDTSDQETKSIRFSGNGDSDNSMSFIASYINEKNQIVFEFADNDPQQETSVNYTVYELNSEGYPEKVVKFTQSKDGSMSSFEKEYTVRSNMIQWENV